jgi:parallel beta-helix repeat protein
MNRLTALLVLAGLGACAQSAQAAESYDSCTGFITSVPKTITQPGVWCMNADLALADPNARAITIAANNVVIDCNDRKLDGTAAGAATSAYGITATNRLNATVRHCNVLGFQQGIRLYGTGGGHVVEDNRVDGSTYAGITVHGAGSMVRNNQVNYTGGSSTVFTAFGMIIEGAVDVLDNSVSSVTAAGSSANAYGIYANASNNASIAGNRVRDVLRSGTKVAYGIFVNGASRGSVRGNEVGGNNVEGSIGVRCTSTGVRVRNSAISGFPTPMLGCGDAGGNDLGL